MGTGVDIPSTDTVEPSAMPWPARSFTARLTLGRAVTTPGTNGSMHVARSCPASPWLVHAAARPAAAATIMTVLTSTYDRDGILPPRKWRRMPNRLCSFTVTFPNPVRATRRAQHETRRLMVFAGFGSMPSSEGCDELSNPGHAPGSAVTGHARCPNRD